MSAGCLSVGVRWAVVVLLAASAASAGAAEPRRIMIRGQALFEDYLRDRLPADANAQIDDFARSTEILEELGIRNVDFAVTDAATYSNYCAYSPVDALIFVDQFGKNPQDLTLTIHRPGGVWQKHFPYAPTDAPGSFLAMTREALACVADQCRFSPEEKAALLDLGFAKDEAFRQYYIAKCILNARNADNLGEVRIQRLLPILPEDPANPILAAEILRDAEVLHAAQFRSMAFAGSAITLSQSLLPLVLGTSEESSAHAILRRFPERFERVLLEQCAPLVNVLDVEIPVAPADDADAGSDMPSVGAPMGIAPTPERARGALRLLGVIRSKEGLPLLLSASKCKDAMVREAAGDGLAGYDGSVALERLRGLADDPDERVACAAVLGLWRHGIRHGRLLPLARGRTGQHDTRQAQALAVLATLGDAQDGPALRRLCTAPEPKLRLAAAGALVRLNAMDDATLADLLADGQEPIVTLALSALSTPPGVSVMAQVRRLANDVDESLAELARMSVMALRPKDERAGLVFDLEMEHTYVRLRRIEQLRGIGAGWATDLLDASCHNRNVYVRAAALAEMMRRDPLRGRERALQALSDASPWMRFAAASVLTKVADPADARAVRRALESETDRAIRVCLGEALARAEGKPPPAPLPSARSIEGQRITVWDGAAGPDSPFNAHFESDFRKEIEAKDAALHESGTLIFGRLFPVYNPGSLVVDRKARDACWKDIDTTLTATNLAFTDGYVFGDGTMGLDPDALWPAGWRLFCLDARLDPARVRGMQTNLTAQERRAWANWANERCVDGFNDLYDYVKGKIAKLRPGIQVCTFLPMPGARFDAIGMRHLKADSRLATYSLVRQYKTLWPERPVVCFVFGILHPDRNIIQRGWTGPGGPILDRADRAYADATTAYLAGADVGWWSYWPVYAPEWKEGVAAMPVGLSTGHLLPGDTTLSNALDLAFRGAASSDVKRAGATGPGLEDVAQVGRPVSSATEIEVAEIADRDIRAAGKRIEDERERMYRGLLYFGMYLSECARVFADLPRQNPRPAALAIQPVGELFARPAPGGPLIPGMALLNQYDFLCDLNQAAALDLPRYRFISVHYPGGLLRDATLAALTQWLKEQHGLLYIHGAIESDNAAEASVIGDMDGLLKNDWPWEADLTLAPASNTPLVRGLAGLGLDAEPALTNARVACTYAPRQATARVLASTADGQPLLVLWRRPDIYQGAVLFDGVANAPKAYIEALRGVINALQKDTGIGLPLDGPILHAVLETTNLLIAATPRDYAESQGVKTYKGLDLLTGQLDPVVGPGASGVMIGREFVGRFAASLSGLAILSTQPLGKVERMAGGIRLHNSGLVRVASETGRVTISPEGGSALPVVKDPKTWLILGTDEGVATLPVAGGAPLTYYRCGRPVTITSR